MKVHHFDQSQHVSPLSVLKARIAVLEKFEDKINDALAYGGGAHSYDDVCADVLSGKLLLINNDDAAVFVEIVDYTNYKAFHVFVAVGELSAVLELEKDLPDLAKACGCSKLSLAGRKGWVRTLTQLGWRQSLVIMTKDVDNG